MSEALDKVRGVRELPVFPLPLVLFPGVPLPLHIFEERYRRMLADVRASNNLFGLSYFAPGERGDPYLVARVEFFEDEEEDAGVVARRAEEVTEIFMRIARAMRTANDERGALPELPADDPERLSFLVAAVVEMDAESKQRLLETRSTTERLRRLYTLLAQAVTAYEERARTHELARGNGHAGKRLDLEE